MCKWSDIIDHIHCIEAVGYLSLIPTHKSSKPWPGQSCQWIRLNHFVYCNILFCAFFFFLVICFVFYCSPIHLTLLDIILRSSSFMNIPQDCAWLYGNKFEGYWNEGFLEKQNQGDVYVLVWMYRFRCRCRHIFVMRMWLRWLWRLTSPKPCSWQAADPGDPMSVPVHRSAGSTPRKS